MYTYQDSLGFSYAVVSADAAGRIEIERSRPILSDPDAGDWAHPMSATREVIGAEAQRCVFKVDSAGLLCVNSESLRLPGWHACGNVGRDATAEHVLAFVVGRTLGEWH